MVAAFAGFAFSLIALLSFLEGLRFFSKESDWTCLGCELGSADEID
jgi:hypothetical protein